MAILFDLKVVIETPAAVDGLQQAEKDVMFHRNSTSSRRGAKPDGRSFRQDAERGPPQTPRRSAIERLEEINQGYTALSQKIDERLSKIEREADSIVFNFDPKQRPDLAEAISQIFKGSNNKITYKMYLAAKRLEQEISLRIGEELSNGV